MKRFVASLALFASCGAALMAGEGSVELYGLKGSSRALKLSGWGGCSASEAKSGSGESFIEIAPSEGAKQWCGVVASFECLESAKAPLSPELLESGFLRFELNGGLDEFDRPSGSHSVQVAISQKEPSKSGGFVGLESYMKGSAVDSDPATWQEVKIPLKTLVGNSGLKRFDSLRVQFRGTPSQAPLLIRGISLHPK